MTALPPVVPCSCGDTCTREGWVDEEPCYGTVEVIDEEYGEGVSDGNLDGVPWHDWTHGCEGHRELHGPYKPFVPPVKP